MQDSLKSPTKRAARNKMEGCFCLGISAYCLGVFPRSTGGNVKLETDLTEPQGKLKNEKDSISYRWRGLYGRTRR